MMHKIEQKQVFLIVTATALSRLTACINWIVSRSLNDVLNGGISYSYKEITNNG